MKKLNSRFGIAMACLAGAAILSFILIPLAANSNGKTEIVRIIKPVTQGMEISEADLESVEVGNYHLPADVVRKKEDVVGKYAAVNLYAGDYLLPEKLSSYGADGLQLSNLPSGKMAMSISLKSLASGVSDKLQAGDVIRIYNYPEDLPELSFVRVLVVTDAEGYDVNGAQSATSEEERRQSATVTLLVTADQAKILTFLETEGSAHLALICRNNETLATELLQRQDAVLAEIHPAAQEE